MAQQVKDTVAPGWVGFGINFGFGGILDPCGRGDSWCPEFY